MTQSKKYREQCANVRNNSDMSNFIYTFKYVILAEHMAGIYRFSNKGTQLQRPHWLTKIFAMVLIVFYIGLYIVFLHLPTIINGRIDLAEVIDEIPCIICLIQYVTTLTTTTIMFSELQIDIFTTIVDLDNQLISIDGDQFYQKARLKSNKFLLLVIVSHIIISVTDIVIDDDLDPIELIFLPLYLIHNIEVAMFCLSIELLKSRLDIINGYIAKFFEENDRNKNSISTVFEGNELFKETFNIIGLPSEKNTKIRDLAVVYETIGFLCSKVNDVFNFQIFMTLISTFSYIIITIWRTYNVYRAPENDFESLFAIIVWCLTTLLTVAAMCCVCERLRLTRKKTKIFVNQIIMDYSLPDTMRKQAKAFMEVIEAWPLLILVYDMFSVDITLMLKFLSVSTTYLIVIIQTSHGP